ncbi:MAG: type II secretion system major pseudopilin GspG [Pseudomonadota bacterium]
MIKKENKRQSGFTLIELLIVMAILALLAGLVGPTLWNKLAGAKTDTAATQIKSFEAALDSYRLDIGRYPKEIDDLVKNNSGKSRWNGPYIKKIPKDPWGNDYQYQKPGKYNKDYDLFSYGADGQEGGDEKEDQDVTNW